MKRNIVIVISAIVLAFSAGCGKTSEPQSSGSEPPAASACEPAVTPEITETPEKPFRFTAAEFDFTVEKVCEGEITGYKAFMERALNTGIIIPALPENFVPQGIDYWDEADVFFITGYFNPADKCSQSVLLAVDKTSGDYVGEWFLYEKSGKAHTGHDGGIAVTETQLYLSTSRTLFRISLDAVKATGGSGKLTFEEEISVPVRASYCNYSAGTLWVGEFSLEGNATYTIEGHDYGKNHAWTLGYKVCEDGRITEKPYCVVSTPEKVQGFTVLEDGRIFMTTSWGRATDSGLYISKITLSEGLTEDSADVSGDSVPVYDFTGSLKRITAMPMAEGVCSVGSDVYMIFESGAYYYRDYTENKSVNPTDCIWKYTTE